MSFIEDPRFTFLLGVGVLILFLWYFATEFDSRKRIIGTVLTLLLVIFCGVSLFGGKKDSGNHTNLTMGIDIKGGSSFLVKLDPNEEKDFISAEAKDQAIEVFRKRVDPDGRRDAVIQPQGERHVLIQVPGIKDNERDEFRDKIQKVAKLDFRLVHPQSGSLSPQVQSGETVIPGYTVLPQQPDEDGYTDEPFLLVKSIPDLTGDKVKNAWAQLDPTGWKIILNFKDDSFGQLTSANVQRRLAIVLNGEVLSAPTLQTAIWGNAEISGRYKESDAKALASALENPLQVPVKIDEERSVDPSLGAATVRQGMMAAVAGLILTLIFMVVFYRVAGIIALIGLSVNIIILFGFMAIGKFTLTLPGIAGIVLTIGIAIDANVLIYERLREELSAGKSLGSAIQAAYDKAFSAIFDANITTLITAGILFMVASGTVKGFAITLTLGILASLFAALIVTRLCFNWGLHLGVLNRLNLWDLIKQSRFDILGKAKKAFIASIIMVGLALVAIGIKNKSALGVDFLGGDLLTIRTDADITSDQISEAIKDLDFKEDPKIQIQKSAADGTNYAQIRTISDTSVQNQNNQVQVSDAIKIRDALRENLGSIEFRDQIDSVGPVVGGHLARSSLLALGLGLVGILLYVTVRFEFSFALGAIIALFHDIIITMGVIASVEELSLIHVGAFLTIAGYSINDSIVVFDRVREGLRNKRGNVKEIMNDAINATLSRTILTSITTLIVVGTLFLFGGPDLRAFALTLIVGVLIGTYSSLFVAAPIVLWWARRNKKSLRREVLDTDQALAAQQPQS